MAFPFNKNRPMKKIILIVSIFILLLSCKEKSSSTNTFIVGGYTDSLNEYGISVYKIDFVNKTATLISKNDEVENPSFLSFGKDKNTIYAVGETDNFNYSEEGSIAGFSFVKDSLNLIFQEPSGGKHPCHISFDKNKLLVSNYSSGTFALLKNIPHAENQYGIKLDIIELEGNSKDTLRQKSPHAHGFYPSPWQQNLAYGVDLGGDKIYLFDISEGIKIVDTISVEKGAGVRHLAFHPTKKWVYAINELNSSVNFYTVGTDGQLTLKDSKMTVYSESKSYGGEIQIHPNGKYLYASNRGENSIALFEINQDTGNILYKKSFPTGGKWPRFFMITENGKNILIANQIENNIVVYSIKENGELSDSIFSFETNAPTAILEK